jgi:hypothetical protein
MQTARHIQKPIALVAFWPMVLGRIGKRGLAAFQRIAPQVIVGVG